MDFKQCTDAELVQEMFPKPGRAAWELEAAWSEFIRRFEEILVKAVRLTYRRYAPEVQLAHEDMRDLVQQIFLKLSENEHRALRDLKCHKENSVKLYLYAIAANTALDCLRAAQIARRPPIAHSLSEPVYAEEHVTSQGHKLYARGANPEQRILQQELLKQVLEVVDSESNEETRARNRLIFFLAHRDGYTRSEIAARSDIDLKRPGINSLLNRIKKKLEEIYNPGSFNEASG